MSEQLSADAHLTPDAPAEAAPSKSLLKRAGSVALDLAKRAWRLDAVKSMALTWAIRLSPIGGAIVVGIIDSYLGAS
jgi:hypothetical protein